MRVWPPGSAARLGRPDRRPDQGPFQVGQVARIAQPAPVIATTGRIRPHLTAPANRTAATKS